MTTCNRCHWGSDEPDGKYHCYTDNEKHESEDSCPFFTEPHRIDPLTGEKLPPLGNPKK